MTVKQRRYGKDGEVRNKVKKQFGEDWRESQVYYSFFFFISLGCFRFIVYICAQILNILWQTLERMKR